ncbi:50S ribosomal protein L29 [Poriferisphaera sp. WC338]|uniref:50S ribosomal protein L29 n=1 Tax=Poriferisphaera sp. WC338 TaxID=3425129 RepID=UPI003D8143F8
MKKSEVHKMSDPELTEEVGRLRKQLFDLKSQAVTEKIENPRQLGNIKKDIARILTEQRSRQLQEGK